MDSVIIQICVKAIIAESPVIKDESNNKPHK